MIKYHLPIILSSSEESGAINKSADGSSFQVTLEKGLLIPSNAKYCWMVCQSAEIWNTSPNILTGVNDLLYIDDSFGALTITIPQGLYDISLLNEEIDRQIIASGRASNSIVIIGNNATQKTFIQVVENGTEIDFTANQTIRDILGFQALLITTTQPNQLVESNNVAAFNNVDYYLVHTDLVHHGIRVNNKYSQTIAQVSISSPTGSIINYEPQQPPEVPCNELIGNKKNILNCWLTNQDNIRINTAGEDWSFRLIIYYLSD
jgi:hypothetical protein